MRTNDGAHPAAIAFFYIQIKRNYIFQIDQTIHHTINFETIHKINPAPAMMICMGTAVFISF
jgi:hypothetical protein